MNNNNVNKFSLSYYSLITQIIIINLITAIIGLIFVFIVNLYLLNNNKQIENVFNQVNSQIDSITDYLEKVAILRTHSINEETNEVFITSEPYLDPYRSQNYIENKYLEQSYEIRVFDTNLTKYVDTIELYVPEDVVEVDTIQNYTKINLFQKYRNMYFHLFNFLQIEFDKNKLINVIQPKKNEVTLIKETIKNKKKLMNIFIDENGLLLMNVIKPIMQKQDVYGVVSIKGLLSYNKNTIANVSFIIWNLFLIIIFFMFLISIIFTKSIVRPIRILSNLAKIEQDKLNSSLNVLNYPIRNDEIGGLSNDIKNMSIELKSRINELEKFTADVAHELKNPLASLKNSNELLAENKVTPENRKLLFNNTIKDLDRMNRLISDISDYTRTQVEVEKQRFDEFELNEFIRDLKSSYTQNKKEINIVFDTNNSKIMIQANKDKLAQVFINLIENAISFSPIKSKILIRQIAENFQANIYLVDQGHGIEQNLKHKIFERFYTDRLDKNDFHTGLGLSISKKIMESFGGSLELSTKVFDDYNGACFKLELPIKE